MWTYAFMDPMFLAMPYIVWQPLIYDRASLRIHKLSSQPKNSRFCHSPVDIRACATCCICCSCEHVCTCEKVRGSMQYCMHTCVGVRGSTRDCVCTCAGAWAKFYGRMSKTKIIYTTDISFPLLFI